MLFDEDETEEQAIEAMELMVLEILDEAQASGLSYFDTACLVFFRAMELGHEMGHFCAEMNPSGHNDDVGDARSSAGYL